MSRDDVIVNEIMDSFSAEEVACFDKEEIKDIVTKFSNLQIFDVLLKNRFLQLTKEISDDVKIDICFECKVL